MKRKFNDYHNVYDEISIAVSEVPTSEFDAKYLVIIRAMDVLHNSSDDQRDRLRSSMLELITSLKDAGHSIELLVNMDFLQQKPKEPFTFDVAFIDDLMLKGAGIILFVTMVLGCLGIAIIGILAMFSV